MAKGHVLTIDEVQERREWLWDCYQRALAIYNQQPPEEADLGQYAVTLEVGARLLDQVVRGRAAKEWVDRAAQTILCTRPERDRN